IENDREVQKREKRAKRFQTDKNAKSWGSPSAVCFQIVAIVAFEKKIFFLTLLFIESQENDPMINDLDYTIVGTCQNLEKSYLRLTSVCIDTWLLLTDILSSLLIIFWSFSLFY